MAAGAVDPVKVPDRFGRAGEMIREELNSVKEGGGWWRCLADGRLQGGVREGSVAHQGG